MSYILDALKQSDKQRPTSQITTPKLPDHVAHSQTLPRWLFLCILVLLVIVSLNQFKSAESTTAAATLPQPLQQTSTTTITDQTDHQALLGVRIELTEPEPVSTPKPAPKLATINPQPEVRPAPPTRTEKVAIAPATPAKPLLAAPKPVVLSETDATNKNQIPHWRQLPPEIQRGLNGLKFSVHIYANNPDARMVKINGQMFRQGQQISDSLQLNEITRQGVILEFRGHRFRMNPI